MILPDTSIWIEHFRRPFARMQELARHGAICVHPFVTGELVAGSLHVRHRMIVMLRNLPQLQTLEESQFYTFVERQGINGKGLGFVDIHLLASVTSHPGAHLWTQDRRLLEQAERLGVAYAV